MKRYTRPEMAGAFPILPEGLGSTPRITSLLIKPGGVQSRLLVTLLLLDRGNGLPPADGGHSGLRAVGHGKW